MPPNVLSQLQVAYCDITEMTIEPDDEGPDHLEKIRVVARKLVDLYGPVALEKARHMERVSKNRIIARSVRVEIERILKRQ